MIAQNFVGMASYFTFIPAVLVLLVKPYCKNLFVRFHAFQSIFFNAAYFVIVICLYVVGSLTAGFFPDPVMEPLLGVFSASCFILWSVCVLKAYQGEKFKLPVIGELAEQQSVEDEGENQS